ncbi:polyphosphate polymerase domain-containing protein [soil metagenome]
MENIDQHLRNFITVNLLDLEKAALLDRIDTKYVFNHTQLPSFLEQLKDHYFVLEIDDKRMFHYESLYFDTDDLALYNLHYCGRLNRYKIRFRRYVESNLSFFEIKFKNNKGRTIKSRISQSPDDIIKGDALSLLSEKTPFTQKHLKATIWVNYIRITLVSKDFSERLTLDLDLTFKNSSKEKQIENLVIAELKQGKLGYSFFGNLMKVNRIKQGSLSKYCYGITNLYKEVRSNNFKEQIALLNKILHAPTPESK